MEHQQIEWKESWRDEYIKWIAAFANAQGGRLVIGKNDHGQIIGLPDAKRLLAEIPNKIRDVLGILVEVNLKSETRKQYLVIDVEPYPYTISYKGQYHVRLGSTKQELKGAALDRFLLRKQGLHWDAVPVPNVSIKNLSPTAFDHFRRQAARSGRLSESILRESNGVLIEKLRLTEGGYLKRSAVLLFHPDPEAYILGACIKIGYFRSDSDLVFQDMIQGDLFAQVEKTMDLLLTKYMEATIRYEGILRVEEYPYAPPALREIILNAVAHKDYSSANPIQISVYPNKIYIWNAGQLPDNWTVDNLKQKHPSIPYNPGIANGFFFSGMIEAWGRGIEKITEACEAINAPLPTFAQDANGLMVLFTPSPAALSSLEMSGKMSGKMTGKMTDRILQLLRENANLSMPALAAMLDKSESTIERAMRQLRSEGRLVRIGPAKGGHWEVIAK